MILISAATRDTVNLVMWGVQERPPSNAPDTARAINEDQFLAKYPWIDIKRGGGPQLQRFGRGTRELLMAMAGGIAPDVIYMTDVDVQDFVSRNFLEPLNDRLEADGLLADVLKDPLARQFTRDGQVYALPYGYGWPNKPMTLVLVYRRDVFRRVGLDPDKPPQRGTSGLTTPSNAPTRQRTVPDWSCPRWKEKGAKADWAQGCLWSCYSPSTVSRRSSAMSRGVGRPISPRIRGRSK